MIPGTIRVDRVIARLNVGGPAIHVSLLTEAFDGRRCELPARPGTRHDTPHRAQHGTLQGRPATFRARLLAGAIEAEEGDMAYFAEERGVDVIPVPSMARSLSPLADLRTLFALWRHFRRHRPHIVHTHTAKAGTLGRLAAVLAGVPIRIHTFHGHVLGGGYFPDWLTRFFRFVETALARLTHRLVVLTEAQKEEMSGALGVAEPEAFAVVPLGLELEPFAEAGRAPDARERARSQSGLDDREWVIGIVGRLVPIKNHELLFDAVALLRDRLVTAGAPIRPAGALAIEPSHCALKVVVVGSGEREDALRGYAVERGVDDCIVWLGWQKDLHELFPAFDVLALTSRDEGTPVAVLEALASGVPVVARDVGGVSEVLDGGKWGRLVADDEPSAVAQALQMSLLAPPPPELREAARASVLARHGIDRLVEDLERIYLEEVERAELDDGPSTGR